MCQGLYKTGALLALQGLGLVLYKYVKQQPHGLFTEVLGHYVMYFLGSRTALGLV